MLNNTVIFTITSTSPPACIGKVAKHTHCADMISNNTTALFNKRYRNRKIIKKATNNDIKIKNASRIFVLEGEDDYLFRVNFAIHG